MLYDGFHREQLYDVLDGAPESRSAHENGDLPKRSENSNTWPQIYISCFVKQCRYDEDGCVDALAELLLLVVTECFSYPRRAVGRLCVSAYGWNGIMFDLYIWHDRSS